MSDAERLLMGLPAPDDAGRDALREARRGQALSPADYLAYLRALPAPRPDELRRRRPLGGEPFTLPGS